MAGIRRVDAGMDRVLRTVHRACAIAGEEGIKALISRSLDFTLRNPPLVYLSVIYATSKFRRSLESLESGLDALLEFAYSFKASGITIRPQQVYEEIRELLKILRKLEPKALLEIGTAGGGTLFLFCRVADPEATIISIDLPGGPFGGGYPGYRARLYRAFGHPRQRIHLIRADSHDPRTLDTVREMLAEIRWISCS